MKTRNIIPLSLTVFIFICDQLTKYLVVKNIPYHTIGFSLFGGFLRIIHTRNLAIGFSIGNGLSPPARVVFFTVVPLIVLVFILIYFLRSKDLSTIQRWAVAGILGGGFGNLSDRIFRPLGVVDFIDVKFYGLFGFERWPTFNVADASVVIFGIMLFITFLVEEKKKNE